jgi:hypothetical protein
MARGRLWPAVAELTISRLAPRHIRSIVVGQAAGCGIVKEDSAIGPVVNLGGKANA